MQKSEGVAYYAGSASTPGTPTTLRHRAHKIPSGKPQDKARSFIGPQAVSQHKKDTQRYRWRKHTGPEDHAARPERPEARQQARKRRRAQGRHRVKRRVGHRVGRRVKRRVKH